jgi:aminopeptidase 2
MSTPVPVNPNEDASQYRLPTSVKPLHYDVVVKTDLEALKFEGLVKVRYVLSTAFRAQRLIPPSLDVVEETSTITLNSSALELGKVYVAASSSMLSR